MTEQNIVINSSHYGELIYIPPLPEVDGEYSNCIKPVQEIAESILQRLPKDQKVHNIYCKDLEAIIHIEIEDHRVNYKAKFVCSWEFDEHTGDYTMPGDIEEDLNISGEVKWDHCSNWTLQEDSGCMLHFCEFETLWKRAILPPVCFILAEKLMPS